MNDSTRTRRLLRAITWIGGGTLSALLLAPAVNAGPLDDLRDLHRMHRRVHQEVRREVRHTVGHIVGRDRDRRHHARHHRDHAPRSHRHVPPGHARRGHVPPGHARHERRYRPRPHHVDRGFHVPPRIDARYIERYRPYYERSVWFEPHGHRHDVYDFPVATTRGFEYRPHHYCDGARFRLDYDRPGLHVNIGF